MMESSAESPHVGLLSREALALLKAFERIRNRKLRRALLAVVEAYGVAGEAESDIPSAG